MKKKILSVTKILEPTTLYLDDIEQIIKIIDSVPLKITLETNEYEYDTLKELEKELAGKTIYNLKISAGEIFNPPFLMLILQSKAAMIHISEDDITSRGLLEKIIDYISKRERKYVKTWPPIVLNTFMVINLIALSSYFWMKSLYIEIVWYIFGITMLFLTHSVFAYRERTKHYSTIILKKYIAGESFWTKHKDQIIVGIIVGIIGAIVGAVFRSF
jgi:hypothetical protein